MSAESLSFGTQHLLKRAHHVGDVKGFGQGGGEAPFLIAAEGRVILKAAGDDKPSLRV